MDYKITAIKLQKRNRHRVNIYLDGEYAFGTAQIVAAWLKVGQNISDEDIENLKISDRLEIAYQHAVKLMRYRLRTEAEIRQRLCDHGVNEKDIDAVILRLIENGLVNDHHFAQSWVDNRNDLRPRSRRALSFELKRLGIDPKIIEQTLANFDDHKAAQNAARKQAKKLKTLEWISFRKKLLAYLARRGFNYETSCLAVEQVWAELLEANDLYERAS